jgi:very-short-patch-repair endonuclease
MLDKYYVLKEEDIENLTYEEIYEKMDSHSRTIMFGHICDSETAVLMAFQDCESPIERILAYALENIGLWNMHLFNPDIKLHNYEKQAQIICGKIKYRVDFLIEIDYQNLNQKKSFIIECDGHDFHEKTKDQVIKNNNRDRDLINHGYIVLHFSGSEIVRGGSFNCVKKIIESIILHSRNG